MRVAETKLDAATLRSGASRFAVPGKSTSPLSSWSLALGISILLRKEFAVGWSSVRNSERKR